MAQARVVTLDAEARTFATGLLPDLIASLQGCAAGDLLRVSAADGRIGEDLESWCRLTGNSIVETATTPWTIRCGKPPESFQPERPVVRSVSIRRVALRGVAEEGIPLSRADLVPEITITADGVYWHPVGAEDADLLVTRDIFPLADAFAAVRAAFAHEHRMPTAWPASSIALEPSALE